MKSHVESVEGTDLRIEIKDRICELSNNLVHQMEGADSISDENYLRQAGHSKGKKYPKHGDLSKESPCKDDRARMMYCNDNEKSRSHKRHKLEGFDNEKESIEKAKRKYFAALVVARKEPGEESLALVGLLRSELESCLAIRLFASFLSPPCGQDAEGT